MDDTNRKILNILLEDSRLSFRQIAASLGIATATAASRIRKMEKQKIIKGYSAILDYEKIGYNAEVIVDITVFKGREEDVMKKLSENHNTFAVYDMTGNYDITLVARFHDRVELNRFLHDMRNNEFIDKTHTRLILNAFKEKPVRI